jgi:hypothetical protein
VTGECGTLGHQQAAHLPDADSDLVSRHQREHNGLLRQYFPKGTDLARWNPDDLNAVAATLNNRPRKTLGWKTPPKP